LLYRVEEAAEALRLSTSQLPTAESRQPSAGSGCGSPKTGLSLAAAQVDAVLTTTAPDRLHHYIVVSLLTGARTEELRALRWNHVHLDGQPDARPAISPHIEVWRSLREGGDTKTRKPRRTLALPARCVEALRKQRAQQAADRLARMTGRTPGLCSPP
jgi:integrase